MDDTQVVALEDDTLVAALVDDTLVVALVDGTLVASLEACTQVACNQYQYLCSDPATSISNPAESNPDCI